MKNKKDALYLQIYYFGRKYKYFDFNSSLPLCNKGYYISSKDWQT